MAATPTPALVTLGETMALFTSDRVGPLRHATTMRVGVAGAESNVAIGLRRLDHPTAWMGRVGADELGQVVLGRLRAERVDVDAAVLDPDAPTGLMVKEHRTAGLTRVSTTGAAAPAPAWSQATWTRPASVRRGCCT